MKKTRHDWSLADAMTDDRIVAAALADPDAQPLTEEQMARKPTPRSKIIRRVLGLTQEAFCERYRIAIGTLRDWEQGKIEPDQTARAYLTAIAANPEGVARDVAPGAHDALPADRVRLSTAARATRTRGRAKTSA